MTAQKEKQYIYIVQASLEPSKCKIGKTNDLDRRLKEYNSTTGNSKDNVYRYLFTCVVKNMTAVENDIKEKFRNLREENRREIYFFNPALFADYVAFIKTHKMFEKEIFIKTDDAKKEIVKIVRKTTPSLEERRTTRKEIMQRAKRVKNDEFFTKLEDIEKELSMYDKKIWKNKTVYCNCDDAVGDARNDTDTSPFALYFLRNFTMLGLKKLICTHYGGPVDLFNQGTKGYIFTRKGYTELKEYPNNYDGSFDHPLSLKLLREEADIVCTNPPFSRSIEYWDVLIESGKKFIIISNITNAINTAYIPYFKNKKVWAGYNRVDYFLNPKWQVVDASAHWYTNIVIKNRPKYRNLKIVPLKEIPEKYKKYDDSKILLVGDCYIPSDYKKPFAVSARPILNGMLEMGYKITLAKRYEPYINGERKFARVLVQKVQ